MFADHRVTLRRKEFHDDNYGNRFEETNYPRRTTITRRFHRDRRLPWNIFSLDQKLYQRTRKKWLNVAIISRAEAIYRSVPAYRSRSSESSFVSFYSFLDYFEIKQRFRLSLEGRNNSTYVATSNGRGNQGNLSAIRRHVAAISSANDLPLSRYSCSRCSLDKSRSASTSTLLRTLQTFREPFRRCANKTHLWMDDEEIEISRN